MNMKCYRKNRIKNQNNMECYRKNRIKNQNNMKCYRKNKENIENTSIEGSDMNKNRMECKRYIIRDDSEFKEFPYIPCDCINCDNLKLNKHNCVDYDDILKYNRKECIESINLIRKYRLNLKMSSPIDINNM